MVSSNDDDILTFFGFKSNLEFKLEISSDASNSEIEDYLTSTNDGKRVKIDFYRNDEEQNRIMRFNILE